MRVGALRRFDLVWLAAGGCLIVVVLLNLYPLIWLLLKSLESARAGPLTLSNYWEVFSNPRYLGAIWNSLAISFIAGALSILVGAPMAWAVARTDMPLKGLVRLAVLGSFITPPFLGAVAWILLAGTNAGMLNRAYVALTGAESGPLNIYTHSGLVFVIVLHTYAFVFLVTTTALELMSSEMEDAATTLGAGVWRTLSSVTLPLALPALLSGFILAFLETMALFGTPLVLGLPARIQMITTQLWEFFQFPSRVEYAAAYALPLLLVTAALFFIQKRILKRKNFATFGGKPGTRRPVRLGRTRYLVLGGCLAVVLLSLVIPTAALLRAALSSSWGAEFSWANLTLEHFRWIALTHGATRQAIANSFLFSIAAACAATLLAVISAYLINRRLVPYSTGLSVLVMAPFVIPGIVLAIGFVAAFTRPPLMLYGTAWILMLAFTSKFLPIAFTNINSALTSVHTELEDAARIGGAGRFGTLREVTLPLIRSGVLAAWLLVLISALRELSTAIFLFSADTKVMSIVLIDLNEEGNLEKVSALGIVMLAVIVVIVWGGYWLLGRQFIWQQRG